MSASESQPPTLRGYDAERRRCPTDPGHRELGPYERSYELRRGYEAPRLLWDEQPGRAEPPVIER